MQGREALVQGLELSAQAVQGYRGVDGWLGCNMHQEDIGRDCCRGSCWRLASMGRVVVLGWPCWGQG